MPTKKKIIPKKEVIAVKEEPLKIPNFSYKQIDTIPIKIEFRPEIQEKITKLFYFKVKNIKVKNEKHLNFKFVIPKFTIFNKLWNKYVNLWNLYVNKEKEVVKND